MKGTKLHREHYTLGEEIAAGGFATIYMAAEQGRAETVAIKLCNRFDDALYTKSIMREAEIIQEFDHRSIVKILPIPRQGRTPVYTANAREVPENPVFFVMEYLEGGTLEDYLRHVKKLSVPEAVTIALEIGRALYHIHEKGFAHNDLKLENIVFRTPIEVNKPFTPVLIDFGVATKVIPPPAATPYIMPPEQIKQVQLQTPPEMDRVDPVKVDVWGLGIMLYCMLGGQLPFKSRREKTLTDRIIRSRPLSLQALSPDVPPDLEELVIDGCLAKDPAHRLTLLEVGQLLRKYVDGRSEVTAQTSGSPAKKSGWASLFGR